MDLLTRRRLLAASAAAMAAGDARAQLPPPADLGPDRLVLLGTRGGPLVTGLSPGPSCNVVVFRGAAHVIDAGYGVTAKLAQAGVPAARVRDVFVTHHHSDHNLELGPLLDNAWTGGLRTPVDVYGPQGVNALMAAYWDSNRFDIETRIADEGRPDPRRLIRTHEFADGPVMADGAVAVRALRNRHPPIVESYALRFDLDGRTVVFSGDTSYFPPLADFARGADFLVHEIAYGPALDALQARRPNAPGLKASILSHHTLAEDVGRIATQAQVKTLVLNHFVPGDDPSLVPEVWRAAVAKTFSGRIIVSHDLLALPL